MNDGGMMMMIMIMMTTNSPPIESILLDRRPSIFYWCLGKVGIFHCPSHCVHPDNGVDSAEADDENDGFAFHRPKPCEELCIIIIFEDEDLRK